jgi:predicted MPP superfamily phosphohydrolase
LFPKYADGLIEKDGKYLHVSRGLGHTKWTLFRVLCKPELAIVKLTKAR